jgi:hypothetical protein
LVAGKQLAEVGDEEIEIPVAVRVRRFDMTRRANLREHLLGVDVLRGLPDPREPPAARVAHENIQQPVPIQISDCNIRDLRLLARARRLTDRSGLPEI